MQQYNLVFFGTTAFSTKILESLYQHPQVKINLIITQPDRLRDRKQKPKPSPVKVWAEAHRIRLEQPTKVRELIPLIRNLAPDFLVTAAYGQKIPQEILQSAKIEPLNVHGSLLPAYRGGAPVQMALWNGEGETGVTLMRMAEAMDAGPLFGAKKMTLSQTTNAEEVMQALGDLGKELIMELIVPIAEGKITPQDQALDKVSFAYTLRPEHERIDWKRSAQEIHNQVRALAPQPGAYTTHQRHRLKIFKTIANLHGQSTHPPGSIVHLGKHSFSVQTGKGWLEVLEVQQAGRNKSNAGVFGRNRLQLGMRFD